jgi:hypothetical protein
MHKCVCVFVCCVLRVACCVLCVCVWVGVGWCVLVCVCLFERRSVCVQEPTCKHCQVPDWAGIPGCSPNHAKKVPGSGVCCRVQS